MIDWTVVIAATIPAVPATMGVILAAQNRRSLRTPSGDPIGHVVERTHDLAAIATMTNTAAYVQATDGMVDSKRRLNDDPTAPVKVNGDEARHDTGAAR